MLTKVTITDTKNTPLGYVSNIWEDGVSWEFKPGVNIIVGENGCGKSTLINLIAKYGLCTKGMVSKLPDKENMLEIADLFTSKMLDDKESIKDGCVVNMDYNGIVFRYTPSIEQKHNEDILDSIESVSLYMNAARCSMGEGMLNALCMLMDKMNTTKDVQFPIGDIKEYAKSLNPVWSGRMKMLLDYYAKNQIIVDDKDFEFTILLDEPDRNLDIMHIKELYNILSYHRNMTQLVCVIHNPVLIYKLMQADVHFVEMTPNYLSNVRNLMRWAK